MDSFLLEELENEIFWPEPIPVVQSSFVPYAKPIGGFHSKSSVKGKSISKRMIEFLRAHPTKRTEERQEDDNDRSYRHMINERLRREKQKQTYDSLHSLLPRGTKIDKNSVLQTAALQLQELKGLKEELQARNRELEKKLLANEGARAETAVIRLKRQISSSGIDSILGVLRCLNNMGLKVRTIRSEFSVSEFLAALKIEPKIEALVVEKAVQGALEEVERNCVLDFPTRGW
ncbi:hypothetical protein IFM89_005129 [Coptis chinensis]|uniref:BHLH domain-containing protein n=1 Tax=Coptis chinensis TaxID=261450 RepID=A0A835IHL8_9MAGN|nr:hypothetical protein IFM89_005129 [Coptis chinensis]